MAKGSACKADIRGFESHQHLVKEDKHYVRRMYGWTHETGWHDIYEVYTQPRMDYLKARLYHVYDTILTETRIDKVQDWLWARRTGHSFDNDFVLPPSIDHDCKCYDLDVKNQTVLGTIQVERDS